MSLPGEAGLRATESEETDLQGPACLWVQRKALLTLAHSVGTSGHQCCCIYSYARAIPRPTSVRPEAMPGTLGWASLPLVCEE